MQTPTKSSADDDESAMQSAFQEFMMSSGGKQKNVRGRGKNKNRVKPDTATSATVPVAKNIGHHQRSVQRQKIHKQYWQMSNAFRQTLQQDWLEVDDHLGEVLASVVNFRDRIRLTSKHLRQLNDRENSCNSSGQGYGYRHENSFGEDALIGYLTKEDLELALSHGLIQHEKMLAGIRKLIASMNQAQEALGRRLEDLMVFHLETRPLFTDLCGSEEEEDDLGFLMLQWSRQVYIELAEELYRKQCLVQTVFDSVDDRLIYRSEDDDGDSVTAPLKVAEKCFREWTRGGYIADLLLSKPWDPPKEANGTATVLW